MDSPKARAEQMQKIRKLVLDKMADEKAKDARKWDDLIANPIDPQHLPPGMRLNENGQLVTAPIQAETADDLFSDDLMAAYDDC